MNSLATSRRFSATDVRIRERSVNAPPSLFSLSGTTPRFEGRSGNFPTTYLDRPRTFGSGAQGSSGIHEAYCVLPHCSGGTLAASVSVGANFLESVVTNGSPLQALS